MSGLMAIDWMPLAVALLCERPWFHRDESKLKGKAGGSRAGPRGALIVAYESTLVLVGVRFRKHDAAVFIASPHDQACQARRHPNHKAADPINSVGIRGRVGQHHPSKSDSSTGYCKNLSRRSTALSWSRRRPDFRLQDGPGNASFGPY
jgi:hypothetical protein